MNKQEMIDTLRTVADFIESRPFSNDGSYHPTDFYLRCDKSAQFVQNVAAAGNVMKSADQHELNAEVKIGRATLKIYINHQHVCERVKVGEKTIPAEKSYLVPATEARIEDVMEWRCPESFLALKDEAITDEQADEPA